MILLTKSYSVQAMTRTPPVYTVRWSSQISRLNNRLGPPTPVPNAVSSAPSMSILNFKFANLYRNDKNHCFSTRITYNNNINNNTKEMTNNNTNNDNDNDNNSSTNDSYVMSIVNCNQYKSLMNRLDDAVDTDDTNTYYTLNIFALIANNKLSCLFIALWSYNFLAVEIQ